MTLMSDRAREAPVELVTLTIDGIEVSVPKGTLVIRAAELIGIDIPRFCDHPLLDPVGACRQCLVDIPDAGNGRGFPKPQASCTIEVAPGMDVRTQLTSEVAEKAQKGTMEFLLVNHPLDCPVCDKGGECPLQNQAMTHGQGESRFIETKRTFEKPISISEQVLLDRERCILCARCTRFSDEIAGDPFIAMGDRGALQQVAIYEDEPFESYFSGNTIQICPVGALTSADYRFRSRPFDLISVPSVAEHDACGAAIRVDHRRGKVMRRLSGDDPEVNEEWITDKDRFCFTWDRLPDRLETPLLRDPDTGELEAQSWPGALAWAADLIGDSRAAVLTGGRLTREDAYAYSKFARVALGTHDIDFRARAHSAEEEQFLASRVAAGPTDVTYRDFEKASRIVLVGLEPEDEAGTIFLRLRKAVRRGARVTVVASHVSRGAAKLDAELIPTEPGDEAEAINALDLDAEAVVLLGERLATARGAFSAAHAMSEATGARLAWIPRRAGDRGALDAGCLPSLLPGGRPVAVAQARADLAAAWGIETLDSAPGRDAAAIIASAAAGEVSTLIVAGVEIDDLPDPRLARKALERATVISLEVRRSEVTDYADLVLPVAPPLEKSGTFVTWDGRARSFATVIKSANALPDVRVLAGIAEELGRPIGVRTPEAAAAEYAELGAWDGEHAKAPTAAPRTNETTESDSVILDTWKQLIDDGLGQDGQPKYRETARAAVVKASAATFAAAGIEPGTPARLSTAAGSVTYPSEIADLPDGVVWTPANNGDHVTAALGAARGDRVTLEAGGA